MGGCSANDEGQGGMEELCLLPPCEGIRDQPKERKKEDPPPPHLPLTILLLLQTGKI